MTLFSSTGRRRFLLGLSGIAVFLTLTFQIPPAQASTFEDEARDFVSKLADKAIRDLTDKTVPRSKRIMRFREFFNTHFAVSGIGKWILGRHWRKASEVEREEYLSLFEDLMVVSYVDRFAAYAGEHLANYKVPRSVDFEAELPRLETGKLYKRLLKDRYWGNTTSRIV